MTIQVERVCEFCSSTESAAILAEDGFSIVQCRSCRASVTSPFDYVARASNDDAPGMTDLNVRNEELTRLYARQFLRNLAPYASGGRFLDIGCSTGVFVDEARRLGYDAEGIDLDRSAVIYGRKQGRRVNHASLEDWTGHDYRVVLLSHTLEHIPEPGEFLAACRERLAPGGHIAVVVPCHTGMHPRLFQGRWYGWQADAHYFHYSPEALRILFRKAGFAPVRIRQNSMDHRPRLKYIRGWKDAAKSVLSYSVAMAGTAIGQGDQLIGIARRD